MPLSALQLLWINFVTDGLPALALAVEPTEPGVMQRRPLGRAAPVISRREAGSILARGALLTLSAALAYAGTLQRAPERAGTVAFAVMVLGQVALSFAFRSRARTLPELGPLSNPGLAAAALATLVLQVAVSAVPAARELFGIAALRPDDAALVLVASLAPVSAIELLKLARRAFARPA
jgi:Ca2+-transporting ATPase